MELKSDGEKLIQKESALGKRICKEKQEAEEVRAAFCKLPIEAALIGGVGKPVFIEVNSGFFQAEGYSAKELLEDERDVAAYICEEDQEQFLDIIRRCLEKDETQELEVRVLTKGGNLRWELLRCRIYFYLNEIPYYILTSWDIDQCKQAEYEWLAERKKYELIEEIADEISFEYDVLKKQFLVPSRYCTNEKLKSTDKKYLDFEEMLAAIYRADREKFKETVLGAAGNVMIGSMDYRMNISSEGEKPVYTWYRTVFRSIADEKGQITCMIGRSYDVRSNHKLKEKVVEEIQLDPLTRLYNKIAIGEVIGDFIEKKPDGTHVLLLIDIDNFKRINDTFGHMVGDTVISDIAGSIREQFDHTDVIGRIGGDEFLVFMKNASSEDAVKKAKKLCQEAKKQLIGDDGAINVTLSVGIAVYGIDGDDYEVLFGMADRAMYHAKRNGKNNFSFAGEENQSGYKERRKERIEETEFQKNMDADEEFLHFAFSLLSHAKDINGSLNVLIEQIGRKYSLNMVSVFEYDQNSPEMTLTNSWVKTGTIHENIVLPRTVEAIERAKPGEFVEISEGDIKGETQVFLKSRQHELGRMNRLAGIKFEISGNGMGCLYIGVQHEEDEKFGLSEIMTFRELGGAIGVFASLRNQIRSDQKEIQNLQSKDKLTGLYNMEIFCRKTEEVLHESTREDGTAGEKKVYAIVHADIDNFAYVNENFGQQVGDDILRELADMIQKREGVIFACRMYSDYFIIFVEGDDREDIYNGVVEANRIFQAEQKEKYPSAAMHLAVGICYVGDGEESFDSALDGANLARKMAKEQKNAGIVVFEEGMRQMRDEEMKITARFYEALENKEFEVFLQPKFLLKEKEFYGAEALARWRLSSGEMMSPGSFIPPLENIGYIVELDFYILEQVLKAMRRWQESGRELFTISSNFSRRHFENGGADFVARLEQLMEHYQIERKNIEIEVTESVVFENLEGLKDCLLRLEGLGYRIAIDDFGTGYSSLSVLPEIPANVVKIDKSFTDRINFQEQREFVSGMGQFIRTAKGEVIFEGIEDEEQCEFLMNCGFIYGQGYFYDAPLPVEKFEQKYL